VEADRRVKHVVMFSGGVTSWEVGRRVVEKHGTESTVLLFADTQIEDEDTYRFVAEASADLGLEPTIVADGRDPWQIFRDVKFLGNSRIDPCSRILKRELLRRWLEHNATPARCVSYLGFDWTEPHRHERAIPFWAPWPVASPLLERPYVDKADLFDALRARGVEPPRLYADGFEHNNCGGFCIKAGQAQFERLLRTNRDRYLEHEAKELDLRAFLEKDVAIMRDRGDDDSRPLTMQEFRERIEVPGQEALFDTTDWGSCSCFDAGDE